MGVGRGRLQPASQDRSGSYLRGGSLLGRQDRLHGLAMASGGNHFLAVFSGGEPSLRGLYLGAVREFPCS